MEYDFVCPACGAEETLLDTLVGDEEKEKQVQKFLDENSVKRGDTSDDALDVKKRKLAMPVPPFGMPFPMFPMPFLPNMNNNSNKQ